MTILAAIGETERSREVIEIAHEMAVAYEETFVALHVVREENYHAHRDAVREVSGFGDYTLTQEEQSARDFARQFVREVVGEVEAEFEPRGAVGDVTEEIFGEIERTDPRFLVIGGRRRSPARKAVFGHRTQRILLNADCPVVSALVDA